MDNFAPVLILTLCRYEHFKKCVESLSACTHANKTDLFIAFDYPLNDSHWDGYKKIEDYVGTIQGFRSVNVIKRDFNYGTDKNYFDAQAKIFEKYDRIIFSEDDNEFAPNFLDFINKGLCEFKDDPKVNVICGYSFPIEITPEYDKNYYFSQGFSAWGFGIWKTKFEALDWNIGNIKFFLYNPLNVTKLNDIQYDLLQGLINIVKTGSLAGDRIYCYNNRIKDNYTVFPVISKVRNCGHDGSGVHGTLMSDGNIFITQVIDTQKTFDYDSNVEMENTIIYRALRDHNHEYIKNNYKRKFKLLIKYLLFRMNIHWNKSHFQGVNSYCRNFLNNIHFFKN